MGNTALPVTERAPEGENQNIKFAYIMPLALTHRSLSAASHVGLKGVTLMDSLSHPGLVLPSASPWSMMPVLSGGSL